MSLDSRRATLEDVSEYFLVTSLWPAVLYTLVLMVTGILGNTLVLLAYRRQFRRSVTRMFIFTLAALDLGSCLITMPSELSILFRFASFPSSGWCKASRFLTYTFNGSSSLILIAIAMDRYFKVCRPYRICVTIPIAQKICVCVVLITAVLSIPSLLLYGDATFPVQVKDGHAQILPRELQNATWMPEGWHINNGVIKHGDVEAQPNRMGESGKPDGGFIFLDRVSDSSSLARADSRSLSRADSTSLIQAQDTDTSGLVDKMNKDGQGRESPQTSDVSVIQGHFCLISSEDSGSTLAVLFYSYMFLLWLTLLVLVVYFYSRVAQAMFLLRDIHDKMFSLGDGDGDGNYCNNNHHSPSRRSTTPRTLSLAQEYDQHEYHVQYHHQKAFSNKGQGQIPTEGVMLISHEPRKSRRAGKQDNAHNPPENDVSSNADLQTNDENVIESQLGRVCEVSASGSRDKDTDEDPIASENTKQDLSLNSLNSIDSEKLLGAQNNETSLVKQVQVSADSVYETGSLDVSSCSNLPQGSKEREELNPEKAGSPRSKSMDDVLNAKSDEPHSFLVKKKSFRLRRFSSKRKSGKVPKIKVSQIKEKNKSNDLVLDKKECGVNNLHPATTNNLLLRRIKSMENVNAVPKLDCLQVPSKGKHHGSLNLQISPEKCEPKEVDPKRRVRETGAVIGTLTNSSTSLQYTKSPPRSDESSDVKEIGEKTLTLTRSSGKGKKNVCVLPLTGLTQKAAMQNQETEEKMRVENIQKERNLPNSATHASILAPQNGGFHMQQRRGSGMDTLEHSLLEEQVKFRSKGKMSRSSVRKSVEIQGIVEKPSHHSACEMKHGGQGVTIQNNTRSSRPRPSTVDILSERHRRGTLHPMRTSRMLFLISMVFLVSFLPFFVIVLMRSAIGSSSFLGTLRGAGLGAVSVFIRSTLISNAVNPVIYGLMSTHFRRECTGLLRCFRK